MTEKNELLHMLDQAIELVRKEPGYVVPFAFHMTHLEAMRAALAAPVADSAGGVEKCGACSVRIDGYSVCSKHRDPALLAASPAKENSK